jgi:hypothetical protein
MTGSSDVQYRMKCLVCGQVFLVDSFSSKIPRHPQKGQTVQSGESYIPCPGSGQGGIVAGTKYSPIRGA